MKLPDSDQLTNVLERYLRAIPVDRLTIDERVELVLRALKLYHNVAQADGSLSDRYLELIDRLTYMVDDNTPDPHYEGVAADVQTYVAQTPSPEERLLMTADGQLLIERVQLGPEQRVYSDGEAHYKKPIVGYSVCDLSESDLRELLVARPHLTHSIVGQMDALLGTRQARLQRELRSIEHCRGEIHFLLTRFTYPQQRVE